MLALCVAALVSAHAHAGHAIAQYGEPKYPPGFTHFDYVNPDAPKGGTLVLANPSRQTSFDKFNPFTLRGNSAPGTGLLFESLTVGSDDETATAYGLLADDIVVAPDGMSVRFHLNPAARFSNGDPVTAADVKYSFDTLLSTAAAPTFRVVFADVARAVVLDPSTVRFDFKRADRSLPLLVGGVPVFSPKWGIDAAGRPIPFDKLAFEPPIASGPYVIDHYSGGRDITYRRSPHYWGATLPVRRGMFNFDHIVYKLYGDDTARLEAFKAGEFDAIVEYRARNWVRSYIGRHFDSGELIKHAFPEHNGTGMQGFVMNLRRPLFSDKRVRRALDLAFDFQWLNRHLFYNQYERITSYFTNTALAAAGLPDDGELALLAPWRNVLDPAVFGPPPVQPTTAPPASLRTNLIRARGLLADAGWTYRDGALRNAQGQPFEFELLDDSGGAFAPIASAYARALQKLGIVMHFRQTDFALYRKRIDDFDFDMTVVRYGDVQTPGIEETSRFGSRAAVTPGSENLIGLHSPAVDAMLLAIQTAHTRTELTDATHALDRILLQGWYIVPQWYTSKHRIAYRRTLAYPAKLPLYYTAEDWIVSQWWNAGPAPAARPAR